MKITVEPTGEFFAAENVTVRAWRGTDEAGAEVIALVAAIFTKSTRAMPGMTPIPPPLPEASEETLFALTAVWESLERLDDDKTTRLLCGAMILAESLMNWRVGFHMLATGWIGDRDFETLTRRIERLARWSKVNQPLTDDEQATVTMMIKRQVMLGPSLFEDPDGP